MEGRYRLTKAKKKTDPRVEELVSLISNLDGLNLELAKDMLKEYCWMLEQMDQLKSLVDAYGVVEVTERGGAGNRHEVKEESKYFLAYQRLVPKTIAVASAIKKFCKDNEREVPEDDGFDEL